MNNEHLKPFLSKVYNSIELTSVGQLVEDLAEFEEEYSDWDVVCRTPDGKPCYINEIEADEDGNLLISMNEDVDETYDVATLLEVLGEYDDDTLIYVAARGLYLSIDAKSDSTIFEEDHDEESDIEIVSCRTSVIDKCNKEDTYDDIDVESSAENDEPEKNGPLLKVVLMMGVALCTYGLYYNVITCIKRISFENVAAALFCLLLIVLGIRSLIPSKRK